MKSAEINKIFFDEFESLVDRFKVINILLSDASNDRTPGVAAPGVYVFLDGDKIIKVGRSLTNSRKRALEHIPANTGGTMAELINTPSARLMLFNIVKPSDIHWVCALEVFFESKFRADNNLLICSGRIG